MCFGEKRSCKLFQIKLTGLFKENDNVNLHIFLLLPKQIWAPKWLYMFWFVDRGRNLLSRVKKIIQVSDSETSGLSSRIMKGSLSFRRGCVKTYFQLPFYPKMELVTSSQTQGGLVSVLHSFMSTWDKLMSSERRTPQLRKCLHKMGL